MRTCRVRLGRIPRSPRNFRKTRKHRRERTAPCTIGAVRSGASDPQSWSTAPKTRAESAYKRFKRSGKFTSKAALRPAIKINRGFEQLRSSPRTERSSRGKRRCSRWPPQLHLLGDRAFGRAVTEHPRRVMQFAREIDQRPDDELLRRLRHFDKLAHLGDSCGGSPREHRGLNLPRSLFATHARQRRH